MGCRSRASMRSAAAGTSASTTARRASPLRERGAEQTRERCTVGTAEPGACVPPGTCAVGGRVAEIGLAPRHVAEGGVVASVEDRVEEAHRCAAQLVHECDE